MTIEFRCSSCNKLLRTSDDRAGARAKCPDCGTAVTVPRAAGGDFDLGDVDEYDAQGMDQFDAAFGQPAPSRRPAAGAMKSCPMCGAEIRSAAVKCRFCGEMLGEPSGRGGARRGSVADASSRVQGPAIALLISFSLTFAILLVGLLLIAVGGAGGRANRMAFPFGNNPGVLLIMGVVQAIVCIVILIGAWQMRGLRSYGLAMTASILSMIPYVSPCCLLGLPFGIWSIVVLNDPDVKNAFD
jgi:phage FluMu protein Com